MGQTICLSQQTSANQLSRKRALTADSIPKSISCLSQRSKNIFPQCHSFFFLNYALQFWWMLTDGSWMLTDAIAAMLTYWGTATVVFKIVPHRFWLAASDCSYRLHHNHTDSVDFINHRFNFSWVPFIYICLYMHHSLYEVTKSQVTIWSDTDFMFTFLLSVLASKRPLLQAVLHQSGNFLLSV